MPDSTLMVISILHLGEITINMVGKMICIREGLIAERLYACEYSTSEIIRLEVTVSKKKWCVTFAYRPPYDRKKDGFFQEVNNSLSNITRKYEYVLAVGDLNIDILDQKRRKIRKIISLNYVMLSRSFYTGNIHFVFRKEARMQYIYMFRRNIYMISIQEWTS